MARFKTTGKTREDDLSDSAARCSHTDTYLADAARDTHQGAYLADSAPADMNYVGWHGDQWVPTSRAKHLERLHRHTVDQGHATYSRAAGDFEKL
jgi:hypothetical protein